jgi:alkylhydroperoxidase family enzyme
VGREQGITEAQLKGLGDYEAAGCYSPAQTAALRFADAMASTPVDVSESVWSDVRAQFDERQIVELTSALAWANYRARFDHALGVGAADFSRGAYCPLPVGQPTGG